MPAMLITFGSEHPAAQMTIGQCTEIFTIVLLSILAGRYRMWVLMSASMLLGVVRFALLALSGATGSLPIIWLGIALHGPIFTLMIIAGRIFIDSKVPSRLRGQSQALYSLLTMNVAGILGSLFCETVYQHTVLSPFESWVGLWSVMTVSAMIPLI